MHQTLATVAALVAAPGDNAPTIGFDTGAVVAIFIKYILPIAFLIIGAKIIFGHGKRKMSDNAETTGHVLWGLLFIVGAPALYVIGTQLANGVLGKG